MVVGVLNVTPDSFSDGGLFSDSTEAVKHAISMARAGADWIDVGGESTRPGARPVPAEEELRRVLPVIRGIRERLPAIAISIDTTKGVVAEDALRAGANLVNDVSGLRFDAGIGDVVRRRAVPLVLMHLRGRPSTMQQRPFARSATRSVMNGLMWSIRRARSLGIERSQLIVDPGLGFGKSRRQNYELLARLTLLRRLRLPIMVGASRKSFIQAIVAGGSLDGPLGRKTAPQKTTSYWAITDSTPGRSGRRSEALDFGDAAAVAAAILSGAHIVRVHNVRAAVAAARVSDAVLAAMRPLRSRPASR